MQSFRLLAVLFAASVCQISVAQTLTTCETEPTTAQTNECMVKALERSEREMERYFKAAVERMKGQSSTDTDLFATQMKWLEYRRAHCADVYDMWRQGTYRHSRSAACHLKLTTERTHDIWSAYLTYIDSTPPVLPEPLLHTGQPR